MLASEKPPALLEFPVVVRIPVLWGDQDAFGHVNNTIAIRWFETARVVYLEQAGLAHLMTGEGLGPILASITCHYRRQLNYPDSVLVGARITRIGNSSVNMAHVVYSETQAQIGCEGDSAIVLFNYQTQRSTRVPDDMRSTIARLEGRSVG